MKNVFVEAVKAFLLALLGTIVFYITNMIAVFIVSAFTFIPLLGQLLILLFSFIGDGYVYFSNVVGTYLSYYATSFLIAIPTSKNEFCYHLSQCITGVIIVFLEIVFLVYNLMDNAAILMNIVRCIAGLSFICTNYAYCSISKFDD